MKKEKQKKMDGWRLTKGERMMYYLSGMAEYMGGSIMTTFYSIYMMFQGVNMAKIAVIMLIVKCIDAVDDMVLGFLVDRIHLKEWKIFRRLAGDGKYLAWFRCFFWMFPIATILFFCMPVGLSENLKLVWFFVGYVLYDLTYTLIQMPRGSMIMTITDNVDERNHLIQTSMVNNIIFGVVLGVGWPYLISEAVGFSVSSVAIVSMVVLFFFMVPFAVKGKEYNLGMANVSVKEEETYSIKDMLNCVRTNKWFLFLMLSNVLIAITATASAVQNFIAFYRFNNSMALTWPTLIAFVPAIILQANMNRIQKKFGKRDTMLGMTIIVAALDILLFFVPASMLTLCITIMSVTYLLGIGRNIMPSFVIPDTIEYTRYKTGKDCAGIFNAINSFVSKATNSVAASVGMALLALSGWVSITATDFADLAQQNVAQPQSALTTMWALNTLIPAAGLILSAIVIAFYKLKDSDARLMAQCNSGKISREECEEKMSRKY